MDMAACPWGPYLASLGVDGRIQVYNYEKQKMIFRHEYPAKGATLIWLPVEVQPSGDQLIMGFDDGNLRVAILTIDRSEENVQIKTIQITKPHNRPIIKTELNVSESLLVTAGEDATIFIFYIQLKPMRHAVLLPIGYIPMPGVVTWLMWHPSLTTTVMAGCIHGHFAEVQVPTRPQDYTTITYILKEKPTVQRFTTYKAQIRRNIRLAEIEVKKAEKRERKMVELEKLKADNPGMDIDEEVFLEDSDSEEELEPLHIPEVPNRVLWMQISPDNSVWLSMSGYDAGYIYEYFMDQTIEIPSGCLIIYDGDDYAINNFIYSADNNYLILAMEDGALRVVKINPTDWRDLSDYWQLPMHDNFNGFISRMCFSFDESYFFTCGYDGNIFSYRYKPDSEPLKKSPSQCTPVLRTAYEVDDVDGYTNLSLDEFLIKVEQDRIDRIASEHRRDYLHKIRVLRDRFLKVLKRNDKLRSTQIIPRTRFEIDERISEHLAERFAADLALVKRKLEYNVEESRVGMVKLRNRFADDLDVFPITVKCITREVSVKTERQQKLSSTFFDMLNLIEQKILEEELKNRPPERIQVLQETYKIPERTAKHLEYFLMGLSPSTIEKGLGPQLVRSLRRYRQRKERMEQRRKEWIIFNARKPVKGVNNPDDEAALADAIATIGDFKLKTAPDYTVPKHLRQSTVKKYKQLLHARLNQYNLRHDLNTSILKLRDDRIMLIDYLKKMKDRLNVIQQEIDEDDLIEPSPLVPEMLPEDFPETNLDINVQLPEDPQTVQAKIVHISKGDLLEREVLLMKKPVSTLYPPPRVEKGRMKKTVEPFIDPTVAALCIDTDTPWEAELRNYRLSRYLFEQRRIISKMNAAINKFDDDVVKVSQRKIKVRRDGDLLDLHLISSNQELLILNDFESIENQLQAKVYANMQEMLDMQDVISSLNGNIESNKRHIENLQEEEKTIQQQFLAAAADNKFYDFLRRIFKKKYKPPKVYNPDESSSSSDSSESSESDQMDAGSIDSRDFTVVRLDENVCPKGCDPVLYAKTFELRTKRHGVELQVKDLRADIEAIIKEIATKTKKLKMIDRSLKESQKDLEAYQREKQKKINLVATTVVLKLNQLQHLVSSSQSSKVGDVLLFSKDTLSNLYARVGQLHNETMNQKSKHKGNITHMTRMRTDCNHMHKHIAQLKAQIKELMVIKFGQIVDVEDVEETSIKAILFGSPMVNLDNLEESALRKMVFDLRVSKEHVDKLYKDEISLWTQIYANTQVELTEIIKGNTSRLDLLGLLNKEKAELARTIDYQAKKREKDTVTESDILKLYGSDLDQLSNIVKNQRKELKMLQKEIARLKTKGLVIDKAKMPAKLPVEEPEIEEDDQEDELDWRVDQAEPTPKPIKEEKIADSSYSLVSMSALNIAKSLVIELIDTISPYSLTKFIRESLVNHLIMDILQRHSVEEVVENLLALLPIDEPTEAQQEVIETVAEQIFSLQQPETISNKSSASSVVAEIIEKIMQTAEPPAEVVSQVLSELIGTLPLDYLLKPTTIKTIISKVISECNVDEINKEELVRAISNTDSDNKMEMQLIMDKILETVYGTGIDYLYFIEQKD